MAGIGSRMITAVVEKVVPDTLKEYDKDTCMSQINCQSTIVDGKEWLGVSKTKVILMCIGLFSFVPCTYNVSMYGQSFMYSALHAR